MIEAQELEKYWSALYSNSGIILTGEYKVIETNIILTEGPVLLAIDHQFQRHLLIQVPLNSNIIEDKKSKGVQIIRHKLEDNNANINFIDIVCCINNLHQLFTHFIIDILNTIEKDPQDVNIKCIDVLNQWRNFFEKKHEEILSIKKICGLFGELWFLIKILRFNPKLIDCWTGPESSRFDIQSGNIALEVKTTMNRTGRFFEINGIDQLKCPDGGELYLATLKLERVPNNGTSIADLVDIILDVVFDKHLFLLKLNEVNYEYFKKSEYEKYKFAIIENEERIYLVNEDFPKIVLNSFINNKLPNNVIDLDYRIDLSGEPPIPLTDEQKIILINKIVSFENV